MKTHRPWQPHMSIPPHFYNPNSPPFTRDTTLDHFNIVEHDEEEQSDWTDQEAAVRSDEPTPGSRQE